MGGCKMVLQELLFPNVTTCARQNMYYTGTGFDTDMEGNCCYFSQNAALSTSTYFNAFSIGKWKKYTIIKDLIVRVNLLGTFTVRLRYVRKMNGKLKDEIIAEKWVVAEERQDVLLETPITKDAGLIYIQLLCHTGSGIFYGGTYETSTADMTLPNIKIAIGICTFHREQFISHNMELLRRSIFENTENPLHGRLEVFISDNGQTLGDTIQIEQVHVFPNRNLGGSGGFTRAILEIKKVSNAKGFTHILLMDDDIRLNIDSLTRTYTMLMLLKPQYKNAFIGGHMLKIDDSHIQSEGADHWDIAKHHAVKYNYNLEQLNFVVKNEIEDSVNFFG